MPCFVEPTYSHDYQRGVTLVELVITIVIISIALVAVVSVYSNAIKRSADPLIYARSVALAQAYMDEVLTKKYDHNAALGGIPAISSATLTTIGTDTGEADRAQYNDVDDYHNKTYSVQEFISGDSFNDYVNYQVAIKVSFAGTEIGLANNKQAKRIDIEVSNPLSESLLFSAYKGNF